MSARWTTTAAAADDKVVETAPAAVTNPAGEPTRAELGRATAFRRRFAVIYVGLALVGGAGLGALVVVAASSDAGPTLPTRWSSFVPTGTPYAKAKAVARRVSQRYTLSTGAQLAGVISGPPTWTVPQPEGSNQVLIRAIAIQPDVPTGGQLGARDIETTDATNAVQYLLCGYGNQCDIAGGPPTAQRDLLLRREALELALYTFKYLNRINSVLVFLPPPIVNGQPVAAPVTVYFKRKDLSSYLDKPLSATLDPAKPHEGQLSNADIAVVNAATLGRRFQSRYIQAQDQGSVLLLDPVATAP